MLSYIEKFIKPIARFVFYILTLCGKTTIVVLSVIYAVLFLAYCYHYFMSSSYVTDKDDTKLFIGHDTIVNSTTLAKMNNMEVIEFFNHLIQDKKIKEVYILSSFLGRGISYDELHFSNPVIPNKYDEIHKSIGSSLGVSFIKSMRANNKKVHFVIDSPSCLNITAHFNSPSNYCYYYASHADTVISDAETLFWPRYTYTNYKRTSIKNLLNTRQYSAIFPASKHKRISEILYDDKGILRDKYANVYKYINSNIVKYLGSHAIAKNIDVMTGLDMYRAKHIDDIFYNLGGMIENINAVEEYEFDAVNYYDINHYSKINADKKKNKEAKEFLQKYSNATYLIDFTGAISLSAGYQISRILYYLPSLKPKSTIIYARSPGGIADEAFDALITMSLKNMLNVKAYVDGFCLSACTLLTRNIKNIAVSPLSYLGSVGVTYDAVAFTPEKRYKNSLSFKEHRLLDNTSHINVPHIFAGMIFNKKYLQNDVLAIDRMAKFFRNAVINDRGIIKRSAISALQYADIFNAKQGVDNQLANKISQFNDFINIKESPVKQVVLCDNLGKLRLIKNWNFI